MKVIKIDTLSEKDIFPNESSIEIYLNEYRTKYPFPTSTSISTFDTVGLNSILEELFNYFNNDILISAATFKTVNFASSYPIKITGYHAENTLSRIVSLWDFLFKLLNEYLGTELLASYQIRDTLLRTHLIDFTIIGNDDGTYNALVSPKNISKLEKKKLINGLKVFKLSNKDKKNTMYKAVQKEFQPTNRINNLFLLYKQHSSTISKKVRNEIIHDRSLGFKVSFEVNSAGIPNNRMAINFNHSGWVNFNDLLLDIEHNLELLHSGLKIVYEILENDDFPNSASLAGRTFILRNYYCKNCSSSFSIPEELTEIVDKKLMICPKCFSNKKVKAKDTETTNERDYFNKLVNALELMSEEEI